ncbi:MAG: choice-of-anchor B family protein [bacterium]
MHRSKAGGRRGAARVIVSCFSFAVALVTAVAATSAAAPASLNCELLSRREDYAGSYASCWGYVDPSTNIEYAILAARTGTAIYNIADPRNPVLTGFIAGPNNLWREMKTYREFCYVGTEAGGGLQIISLANPEAPFLAATFTGSGLSSIHSVTVDTLNARLYANGANGGCRILSLANPTAPTQIGNYGGAYVHDSHVRDDTLYAACIGIGKVQVLNVANPGAISLITQFTTERNATHNCWTTEDRQFLLATDETGGGRVTSWDISDLGDPIQVDGFTADANGDAHNVHIRDNLAYVAHYTEGVHILDITDPTDLRQAGYFYTYNGGGLFDGAWGVFNYFPSGTIVVSDMQSGMFLVDYWENAGAVGGAVTDAVTGQPIPYAQVSLVETARDFAVSGAGAFLIDANEGSHTVRARAFGYDSTSASVTVTPGDTTAQGFALQPLVGGGAAGTVVLESNGSAATNVIVSVKETPIADTTDVSGAFSLGGLPVGSYKLYVDDYSFQPESLTTDIVASGQALVTFVVDRVDIAFSFEDTSSAGWTTNADGSDNADVATHWVRLNPRGSATWEGIAVQPEDDHTRNPLTKCWVTGQGPTSGGPPENGDVDNGKTTLYSPVMNLTTLSSPVISFWRWYTNNSGENPGTDSWRAQISSNGGTTWVTVDSTKTTTNAWKEIRFAVASYVQPTATVRMRFIAEDIGGDSNVEAALDDFRVWGNAEAVGVPVGDVAGDADGSDGASDAGARFAFRLHANSPNPIRSGVGDATEFRFDLPADADVALEVFTIDGRRAANVAARRLPAGVHSVRWDGRDESGRALASGVYVYRLRAGVNAASRKLVVLD